MARGTPDYLSYLLCLWRARERSPSNRRAAIWRASLQSPQTGERVSFATLEELFAFLRDQADLEPEPREANTMTGSTAVHKAIAAANERFMAAFDSHDAAGVAALYTEDGRLLPPNADVMAGKEAIQTFWQGAMDAGLASAQLEIVEVEDHGDTAIEVSQYTLGGADGQPLDQGKYIVIWKREAGDWKLHRDIFNSSLPAPG
jgi:uncharacterized protein (TIGR02246 family)